jgi:hypothetical protein
MTCAKFNAFPPEQKQPGVPQFLIYQSLRKQVPSHLWQNRGQTGLDFGHDSASDDNLVCGAVEATSEVDSLGLLPDLARQFWEPSPRTSRVCFRQRYFPAHRGCQTGQDIGIYLQRPRHIADGHSSSSRLMVASLNSRGSLNQITTGAPSVLTETGSKMRG